MHMPVETSLGRSNVMIRVTSLTYGTSKLKSYTHNRLERFITLQDLAPIIRVLHSFPEPMGRVRNRRITISYRGFFWRIGPRANMSCQSQSDWNFREHGMHINHGDARPGLRKAGSAKDSLSDPPFLQGWVFTRIPINIILVKDRDSPCYKVSSRGDGVYTFQPLVLPDQKKGIVLRAIDKTAAALASLGSPQKRERSNYVRATHARRT